MKLVGVREFYNITRAKIISAVNCCIVVFVCATATFAVDTALNSKTVQALPVETTEAASVPADPTDVTEPSGTSETSASAPAATSESAAQTSSTSETTEATETSATDTVAETAETTAAETTEMTTTTEATTAETTSKITEKELYIAVYATTTVNVRSGPGTDYDIVKSVYAGDQIDVVAVTSNGWYKTYNGNYVSKDYTTETKPKASPTPKPTQQQATEAPVVTTTEAKVTTPSGEGHVCKITFYGPVLKRDGTYSTTTATGTTCTQGRTCGADWSVYPAGTVIYIENDPLGGDGYYTVEDTGPGATGYHIDIYADDGETGNYSTCNRTVYVV
ncbi:MAG: SH3 domain-containing protein [Clostridiales bacterium]|nr:SH3 domain-containing protein [Clostridiales bacterium]